MIRVQHIRKQYGSTLAVNDVSLDVPDGRVTGLLGPNGAGKTTTIRAITGLTRPDAGGGEVDGVDVARHPMQARAQLGVVPETIGVYDHLTVREHVEYSAEPGRAVGDHRGRWRRGMVGSRPQLGRESVLRRANG